MPLPRSSRHLRLFGLAARVAAAVILMTLAAGPPAAARVWQLAPEGGDAPDLQAAVDAAADGDTLDLASGFYSQRTSVVNKSLLIRGAGIDRTTLNGSTHGHTLALRGANNFTEVRDLTIEGGNASSSADLAGGTYGGGVLGEEALFALIRCRIATNSCSSLGGGIYATALPFLREAGAPSRVLHPRRAAGPAGIIRDHVLIEACIIESNFGGSEGGGLCMEQAYFRIVNCLIRTNFAGQGGGAALINSVGEMIGCLVDNNEALLDGGGIKLDTGLALPPPTMRVRACTIVRNRCDRYGSGLALTSGETIEVTSNLFDGQSGPALSVLGCANAAVYAGGCNHFGTNASPPLDGCEILATDTTGPSLFCNPSAGDWRLCTNSPALVTGGACTTGRGAYGVGCTGESCATSVRPSTWSGIKTLVH